MSAIARRAATPTAVLLDPKQQVARAYGATVTPHMYIIKPDGTLAYAGGIHDKPTSPPADIKEAKNFVDEALVELKAGKPVSNPATRAYGCTVKYSS
ncbi:MAG: redoxin domain-containing protein [Bradyrhizobium sp.]|nr:redoxin domain-containing protein [Bradyrhizobium sp.]